MRFRNTRLRPPLANLLFARSGPSFQPAGALHGAFSSHSVGGWKVSKPACRFFKFYRLFQPHFWRQPCRFQAQQASPSARKLPCLLVPGRLSSLPAPSVAPFPPIRSAAGKFRSLPAAISSLTGFFSLFFWRRPCRFQAQQASNPRPAVLETAALPAELYAYIHQITLF